MSSFNFLQKIGKALMLPVAVLPVAGLLLGIGAAPFAFIPVQLAAVMKASGDVIFQALPLIFAIGVALGYTGDDGVAAIASAVGFLVLTATLGVAAPWFHAPTRLVLGIPSMPTGVFGGILAGGLSAALFQRFHRIDLPPYLGFFAGKRFVPIITALASVLLGIVLAVLWPPVQRGIDAFSHWAAVADPRTAASIYGLVERLLLPFGLHHIWNVPFFFEMGRFTDAGGRVVTGDINRFFAGDPTAGILAGSFLIKMFGLPGAALAIWRTAPPDQRAKVGGIMVSAALTSFLTGITEPIEFAFMFAAPGLYVLHAALTASAQFVANSLGVHMGFTFSQGGIDFLVFNALGRHAQRWALVLVAGPAYGLLYYGLFRWAIVRFSLKTPGREDPGEAPVAVALDRPDTLAADLVAAFGGRDNLTSLDACITRLRVGVADPSRIDEARLKALGASEVLRVGRGAQAIFGPRSERLKADMEAWLRGAGPAPPPAAERARTLQAALGGPGNVRALEALALTRLRVRLADPAAMDPPALRAAGVRAVMTLPDGERDLIVGPEAGALAEALRAPG